MDLLNWTYSQGLVRHIEGLDQLPEESHGRIVQLARRMAADGLNQLRLGGYKQCVVRGQLPLLQGSFADIRVQVIHNLQIPLVIASVTLARETTENVDVPEFLYSDIFYVADFDTEEDSILLENVISYSDSNWKIKDKPGINGMSAEYEAMLSWRGESADQILSWQWNTLDYFYQFGSRYSYGEGLNYLYGYAGQLLYVFGEDELVCGACYFENRLIVAFVDGVYTVTGSRDDPVRELVSGSADIFDGKNDEWGHDEGAWPVLFSRSGEHGVFMLIKNEEVYFSSAQGDRYLNPRIQRLVTLTMSGGVVSLGISDTVLEADSSAKLSYSSEHTGSSLSDCTSATSSSTVSTITNFVVALDFVGEEESVSQLYVECSYTASSASSADGAFESGPPATVTKNASSSSSAALVSTLYSSTGWELQLENWSESGASSSYTFVDLSGGYSSRTIDATDSHVGVSITAIHANLSDELVYLSIQTESQSSVLGYNGNAEDTVGFGSRTTTASAKGVIYHKGSEVASIDADVGGSETDTAPVDYNLNCSFVTSSVETTSKLNLTAGSLFFYLPRGAHTNISMVATNEGEFGMSGNVSIYGISPIQSEYEPIAIVGNASSTQDLREMQGSSGNRLTVGLLRATTAQ